MLLGIFLHTALTYSIVDHPSWPIHSNKENAIFFDWLFGVIHMFRMPIFFIVSGFFSAFLVYHRSPILMIKNRINRILIPFLIFLFLLTPISIIFIKYSVLILNGGMLYGSIISVLESISPFMLIPFSTMHLWFLYYLILFSFFVFFIHFTLKKFSIRLDKTIVLFDYILSHQFLKISLLPIITYLILFISGNSFIEASTAFTPNVSTFVFYFTFYFFGWILFKSKKLIIYFSGGAWTYTFLGIVCFSLSFIYSENLEPNYLMIINSFSTWMFVFGIISGFIKYLNSHNRYMRYLLDASYWIYLIHLPLTILLPGLMHSINISIYLKFTCIILATFSISIVSYHFLVRKTIIGQLLNGKKYL